jgi:hypothetical protein
MKLQTEIAKLITHKTEIKKMKQIKGNIEEQLIYRI